MGPVRLQSKKIGFSGITLMKVERPVVEVAKIEAMNQRTELVVDPEGPDKGSY